MYAGLGLSALIFIIHGLVLHGWEIQNRRMSLNWMGLMAGLNLTGAAAYAVRVGFPWLVLGSILTTRFRFRKGGIHGNMTFMAAAIRYFISW